MPLKFPGTGCRSRATTRGYQYNVTLDGKPYVIQEAATPGATVVIPEGSDLLKAFKVTHNGQTYYNVPNVFSGADPFGYTQAIKAAAKAAGKDENYYLSIPMSAALRPTGAPVAPGGRGGLGGGGGATTIRSGQTTANLTASVTPAAYASSAALGKWQFTASNPGVVQITPGANNSITVAGTNKTAAPVDVIIVAKNELGLEACAPAESGASLCRAAKICPGPDDHPAGRWPRDAGLCAGPRLRSAQG